MTIDIDASNKPFVEYLKGEFKTNGKNLIVIGKPGIGKTYLCRKLIDHDYFISEPTFRQHIVNQTCVLRRPEEHGCDIKLFPLEALAKKSVVIFDDYGKGAVTDAYLEKMYYWLDYRIERGYRTIITTNLSSLEEFKKRDSGIASRLMMNADIYVCDGWKDRRIKKNPEFGSGFVLPLVFLYKFPIVLAVLYCLYTMTATYLGEGDFGPIYEGLVGKEAEDFLIAKQNGEIRGAYLFEKRPVDLVWGHYNKGRGVGVGLAKIVAKHPEVLGKIQEMLDQLPLLNINGKEVVLGNDDARVVIRLQWNGEHKRWLMTAYDIQ